MGRGLFVLLAMIAVCQTAEADQLSAQDLGKDHYLSYGCALCHGLNGDGKGIKSQQYVPPPTNFHDLKAYLHGQDKGSIRRSIMYGIKEDNSIMPAFEDIPAEEVDQMISYLQSLQKS